MTRVTCDVGLFLLDLLSMDLTLTVWIAVNPGQTDHFSETVFWFALKGHGLKFISKTRQGKRK